MKRLIFSVIGILSLTLIQSASAAQHNMTKIMQSIHQLPKSEQGKAIARQFCSNCHGPNPSIEMGAAQYGDAKAWLYYQSLNQKQRKQLLLNGMGAMPVKGGCSECSLQQLLAAAQYLSSHR